MTDKKTEALKLALEALEHSHANEPIWKTPHRQAITAIREALAEQPAQQQEPVYWQWRRKDQPWSLEYTFNSEVQVTTKDSERRALYTSPPAQQQEPVAVIRSVVHSGDGGVRVTWLGGFPQIGDLLYTSPPASKPWVGLTYGEVLEQKKNDTIQFYRAIEAKLKEKNT